MISHLKAEADRLTVAEIEYHEQAAKDNHRAGNTQQAEWHEEKVQELQKKRSSCGEGS